MYDETISVLENKKINNKYYKLVFSSPRLSKKVSPGHFLNIQIENHQGLLLRRPLSYYRVSGSRVELLYEILGRGTALLAQKRKGHELKALGPLGRPFSQNLMGKKRILVAGGVGVPPLIYLAETLKENPKHQLLLIGCKSKNEVLPKKELAKVKCEIRYATDDGSYGRKGFVTALLQEVLKKEDPKSIFIQTCGPNVMMNAVRILAQEFGVEGEASVEERMACGVGACLGCVVETHDGFKTSCVDGPVFSFSELL